MHNKQMTAAGKGGKAAVDDLAGAAPLPLFPSALLIGAASVLTWMAVCAIVAGLWEFLSRGPF